MTATATPPPRSGAVDAFLRGLDRRARLLAYVQSGSHADGQRALAATARVFAAEARQWPIAQWPRQYWRLLLSAPALAKTAVAATAQLPGLARLAPPIRAAVLLNVVAALADDDAAEALGISVEAYQQRIRDALPRTPLDRPDVDVWRAWRAAAQRALEALPDGPPPAGQPVMPAQAQAAEDPPRRRIRMRWLWLGVAVCALALAATFLLHPRGRGLLDEWRNEVKREALRPAAAPRARFDETDPTLHPDRELLAAPQDARLARRLPMLAWLVAEGSESLPPANAPVAVPVDDSDIAGRMRAWARQSPRAHMAQRQAWDEWQALTDAERTTLREMAARFDALLPAQQQTLRDRYAALPYDAHRGWHLGPTLGAGWPRIAALFAQVDPAERLPLLQLLRQASREETEALARLAQTTPPEARAAFRRELLAVPIHQRTRWLQARLQL